MPGTYIVSDNIISPLGDTSEGNFARVAEGRSGIQYHDDPSLSTAPFYASLFSKDRFTANDGHDLTLFERMMIASAEDALQRTDIDVNDGDTRMIISSTKGNIQLLEHGEQYLERIPMHSSAKKLQSYFGLASVPIVVSNACISGVLAILTGKRLIERGVCRNVIVTGSDVVSRFIVSGFESFQAISPEPCRPFDKERKGLNLGEAAATVILSGEKRSVKDVQVGGGGSDNDANHISAPSRTGNELAYLITGAIREAGLSPQDIDFISAHGTATAYNDEMEAKAIHAAGLADTPVHSLKGYFGHTLGAAGLVESIISAISLRTGVLPASKGFETPGVSSPVNILKTATQKTMHHCLKTASGFGGCNAAAVFSITK